MNIVDESEMLAMLRDAKRVFLLEPDYKRKYVPLALAKIATYVKDNGGEILYGRMYDGQSVDLIAMTSLFTYDSDKVIGANYASIFLSPGTPTLVGGVYASLMPKHLDEYCPNVTIFRGYSKELDMRVPDYSIEWNVESPWDNFSYVFTTRGCPNHCPYCAVWRIEPERWVNPTWKDHIVADKPYVMISDNNLSSADPEHLHSVIDYLVERDVRVVFDNGFDCKYVTEDMAARLSKLKFTRSGMRIAFDRIEEDGIFQEAVKRLIDAGVPKTQIMAYVIFNFQGTPRQADYRMRECVKLGIRPYPQQFTPLNATDRKEIYVGKHWTLNLARRFRHFWLMGGLYRNDTFEHYARQEDILTDEDWRAWNDENDNG